MSDDRSIEDLLASDDPSDRLDGVRWVRGRARRRTVPVLLAALSDPDDDVSGEAARRLGGLATATAVPALVREYVRPDRFPGTFFHEIPYAWALEGLETDEAWKPLVETLEGTDDPVVANRCVNLLEDLGDRRSRAALEGLLADLEPDGDRDADDGRALEARGTDLLAHPSPEGDLDADDVRAMKAGGAAWVLDRLDEVEARAEALPTPDDVRRVLDDGTHDEVLTARKRLVEWSRAADTGTLLAALGDRHNEVSAAAAEALGVRGAAEAVPGLVREVATVKRCLAADVVQYPYAEETDLEHGAHARALVRIDDPAAVDPLLDALEAADEPWVAWEIVWVLGWLEDPRALAAVEEELAALVGADGSGWRYRALVSSAETAVARLEEAAERAE